MLISSSISRKLLSRTKNPMIQSTKRSKINIRLSLKKLKLCGLGNKINLISCPLEVEKEVLRMSALQMVFYGVWTTFVPEKRVYFFISTYSFCE